MYHTGRRSSPARDRPPPCSPTNCAPQLDRWANPEPPAAPPLPPADGSVPAGEPTPRCHLHVPQLLLPRRAERARHPAVSFGTLPCSCRRSACAPAKQLYTLQLPHRGVCASHPAPALCTPCRFQLSSCVHATQQPQYAHLRAGVLPPVRPALSITHLAASVTRATLQLHSVQLQCHAACHHF